MLGLVTAEKLRCHIVHGLNDDLLFISGAGGQLCHQVVQLLLTVRHIRVEQRICGKSKAVTQRIQNIKGRVDLAQFYSLDVPLPTVEIIGQILLGEM